MNKSVSGEIVALHQFFQHWFGGRCEESDAYFELHLRGRFAEDFRIVLPEGRLWQGDVLFADMRHAHGTNPRLRIQIRNVETHVISKNSRLILATYEEWQKNAMNSKPPNNARLSTVLLRHDDAAPNGLLWLHVHETWLPEAVVALDPFAF
ncbi:MAG: hypothetical protein ACE5LB_15645 [Acidiferrobacterales bacterium]